jgi:hypothetical protein
LTTDALKLSPKRSIFARSGNGAALSAPTAPNTSTETSLPGDKPSGGASPMRPRRGFDAYYRSPYARASPSLSPSKRGTVGGSGKEGVPNKVLSARKLTPLPTILDELDGNGAYAALALSSHLPRTVPGQAPVQTSPLRAVPTPTPTPMTSPSLADLFAGDHYSSFTDHLQPHSESFTQLRSAGTEDGSFKL